MMMICDNDGKPTEYNWAFPFGLHLKGHGILCQDCAETMAHGARDKREVRKENVAIFDAPIYPPEPKEAKA